MLVCIPTKGNAGLDDEVFGHFGSAPFFTLYNSENDTLEILENRNAHHDHGTCHPMNQLMKYKINSVVCSGMGRRAIEALNTEGIKIYMADSDKVSETVEQIKSGKLIEMDPTKACQGHGQRKGNQTENIFKDGVNLSGRGSGYGQGCQHQNMGKSGGRGGK